MIWPNLLTFIFDRHQKYRNQKKQTDHWDFTGKQLKKRATETKITREIFVDWALAGIERWIQNQDRRRGVKVAAVLDVPPGRFYGPCSGHDLPIAFELFGDAVNRFTFCDLGYRRPHTTAKGAVPEDWTLVSRIQGYDEALPKKTTWYDGHRPFRPRSTMETWRWPDGSEALIELR